MVLVFHCQEDGVASKQKDLFDAVLFCLFVMGTILLIRFILLVITMKDSDVERSCVIKNLLVSEFG